MEETGSQPEACCVSEEEAQKDTHSGAQGSCRVVADHQAFDEAMG
jgi:hypothetical protein